MQGNAVQYMFYQNSIVEFVTPYMNPQVRLERRNKTGLVTTKNKPGTLSHYSKKNIEKKLTAWLTALQITASENKEIQKRKQRHPVFVTLTLSNKTTLTQKEVKRELLQQFIKQIKYNYNVQEVFWKAELQQNNNIHFHLIIDHYIPAKKIQSAWNNIQDKKGLLESYRKKYQKENPPSTHVKGIQDMESSIKYVMKYVMKNTDNAKIDGNVYRFSKKLSKIKPFIYDHTQDYHEGFQKYLHEIVQTAYTSDYFSILKLKKQIVPDEMPGWLKNRFSDYYLKLYQDIYQEETKLKFSN